MSSTRFVNRLTSDQIVCFFALQGRYYDSCEIFNYSINGSTYIKAKDNNGLLMLYKVSDVYIMSYNHDKVSIDAWMGFLAGIFEMEYVATIYKRE